MGRNQKWFYFFSIEPKDSIYSTAYSYSYGSHLFKLGTANLLEYWIDIFGIIGLLDMTSK